MNLATILLSGCLVATPLASIMPQQVPTTINVNHHFTPQQYVADNGVMLDVARRHMSEQQIIACLQKLDYHKVQYVQLHLNDNEGCAIDSQPFHHYGWLTNDQIKHIMSVAKQQHLLIIPDLDVPSHDQALLRYMPCSWRMDPHTCDYTNPTVRNAIYQWYQQVLPLFSDSPAVMIGCDEVPGNVANANDLATLLNHLNTICQQHHQFAIVWNDSLNDHVLKQLSHQIVINDWQPNSNWVTNHDFVVKDTNYHDCYYNTIDLDNHALIKQQLRDLNHIHNGKFVALWGSNAYDERDIPNSDIIAYLQQLQHDLA